MRYSEYLISVIVVLGLLAVSTSGCESRSDEPSLDALVKQFIVSAGRDPQTIHAVVFARRDECVACVKTVNASVDSLSLHEHVLYVYCPDEHDLQADIGRQRVIIDTLCRSRDNIQIPLVTSFALLEHGKVTKIVEASATSVEEVVEHLRRHQ